MVSFGSYLLVVVVVGILLGECLLCYVVELLLQVGWLCGWLEWVEFDVVDVFVDCGISLLWLYQVEVVELVYVGCYVVIGIGLVFGKLLVY